MGTFVEFDKGLRQIPRVLVVQPSTIAQSSVVRVIGLVLG